MPVEALLGRLYKDDETIVEEGMQSRTMYVIQGGKVKVVKNDNGNETVLALLGEGDIFGEMSLFDASPRSASIRAVGEARVLAIEHEGLLKRFKMDPTLSASHYQADVSAYQGLKRQVDYGKKGNASGQRGAAGVREDRRRSHKRP